MQAEKHIALVANPIAAHDRARTVSRQITTLLQAKGIAYSYFDLQWPEDFSSYSEVWIAGGDGTLNYFINRYPGITLPLSIFPGGSGNDFRWMLYGNRTVEQQVNDVLSGEAHLVDAGECNGKLFLNGVGIGFDGAVVKELLGRKMLAGKASYLLSILKQIAWYTEKEVTINLSDREIHEPTFLISVAIGKRYGGGFMVAPRASVTDGLLDLNVVGQIAPLKRIRYLPVIEKGEHLELPFIKYTQTEWVNISCAQPLHAHLDGEYLYTDQFQIRSLPKRFSFLW